MLAKANVFVGASDIEMGRCRAGLYIMLKPVMLKQVSVMFDTAKCNFVVVCGEKPCVFA